MEPPAFRFWYGARMLRVVDADTVDMELDLGFRLYWQQRFRLFGIDTYELNDPDAGKRALAVQGRDYVVAETGAAKQIVAETHLDRSDKFGRWLCVIHYQDALGTWHNLNNQLLDAGLAVPYIP